MLLYFGGVLGTTLIIGLKGPNQLFSFEIYIIPILYAIFLSLNLYKKSLNTKNFSYWKGLAECFAFGTYATLIYTILSVTHNILRILIVNKNLKYDADIVSESIFTNTLFQAQMALVNGIIYTVLLSLIIPFFFIKNKTLEKDIILDDEKF